MERTAKSATDIFKHETISRDQTSTRPDQLLEKLTALGVEKLTAIGESDSSANDPIGPHAMVRENFYGDMPPRDSEDMQSVPSRRLDPSSAASWNTAHNSDHPQQELRPNAAMSAVTPLEQETTLCLQTSPNTDHFRDEEYSSNTGHYKKITKSEAAKFPIKSPASVLGDEIPVIHDGNITDSSQARNSDDVQPDQKASDFAGVSNLKRKYASEEVAGEQSLEELSRSDLMKLVGRLQCENQNLMKKPPGKRRRTTRRARHDSTWTTFHRIENRAYLDSPQWRMSENGPILWTNLPLHDENAYLRQHPEIAFVYNSSYDSRTPGEISQITSEDGVFHTPRPFHQYLVFKSRDMIAAVEKLRREVPGFSSVFPNFDPARPIAEPYMFMYYSLPFLGQIRRHLTSLEGELMNQLLDSIKASHGKEYDDANRNMAKGMTSRKLIKYLIRPGDVLIQPRDPSGVVCMATDWVHEAPETFQRQPEYHESGSDAFRHPYYDPAWDVNRQASEIHASTCTISAWTLTFDGKFHKCRNDLKRTFEFAHVNEEIRIDSLNVFPLRFGTTEMRATLEQRGRTFWRCRYKHYISYQQVDRGHLNSIDERYMIDTETYNTLHPNSPSATHYIERDHLFGDEIMAKDDPPQGDILLLVPPDIKGYNLRSKTWEDLYVDRISDVIWNKKAFKSLVVNDNTKELVEALVTNRLSSDNSTDLIAGKGHGLLILIHGGPGVGKTFTAEGVAELAEKPLYRVTCGDVGTIPEVVEKYLQSVFFLCERWDCVVLLDEADVFLEERGQADFQRNALVSVFLRVLEYNSGIMILTSNRVGTFDEAFKSRIQLALHYENLTVAQQRKIWRNFLNRSKELDDSNVDFEDLTDHIDDLAKHDMNGRQIRNAITTARQLAQFKQKKFAYTHLKHVIEVGGAFESYLKGLREGYSDDQIKKGEGLR